ncbi:HEAT repeat domain-containing protein [Glycomyces salinus]|uniref:HEAT repeat domain-containing protein n=1 Tax=Glycomyces salinus TaxID=980294 RepID=UPI0018EBC6F7|nr:HEAT repeat domain-containing protein [Glycomyces salinus]
MNTPHTNPQGTRLADALAVRSSSTRLKAALAAGTHPDPDAADTLVARSAIEPDFYVRDMLTWALTRLPPELTVPRLLAQLRSEHPQARAQALHTLSKIGDASAWPQITPSLLRDRDDETARSAWRAAVVLVPDGQEKELAAELASQLGRGDREMQRSLSRALVALGEAAEAVLATAADSEDPTVAAHARATERLLNDPDAAFELDVEAAKRIVALGGEERTGSDADR